MEVIEYIPERYKDGYIGLWSIDKGDFDAIITSLGKVPLVATINGLAKSVSDDSKVDLPDIHEIFLSIDSLITLLDKKISKYDIVEQVTSVINDSELIKFSEEATEENFKSRIYALLGNEKVYYASKANELITDNGVVFLDSKIVTDIRPIFDIVLEDSPKVGLITHTLQIHYRTCESSNHQSIYLALASLDIVTLKDVLERAIVKEKSLVTLLSKTGIQIITS